MSERLKKEREVADAIVSTVCPCGPTKHTRGFPECAAARTAARIAVEILMPKVRCQGSSRKPAEMVILDVVPGMNPTASCITCSRSFTLNAYGNIPEHEA